jgi:ParB/RepB/Spo0J family partition protein
MNNPFPRHPLSQPVRAGSTAQPDIDIILSTQDGITVVADASIPSARIVVLLDPAMVVLSTRPNRSAASFETPEFEMLYLSILANDGNVTPIEVRRLEGNPVIYELVSGERRLRACILAGVQVLAMLAEPNTESNDGLNRLRENTGRQELRPWEVGQQVRAVYEQLKPITGVELASHLGMSQAAISRALDISSLPQDMVDAFPSPLDIQVEHVKKLKTAWTQDSDAVLLATETIKEEKQRGRVVQAKDVVTRIMDAVAAATQPDFPLAKTPSVSKTTAILACDGTPYGQLKRNDRGGRELHIDSAMSDAQEGLLVKAIDAFIRHTVRGQPKVKKQVRRSAVEAAFANTVGVLLSTSHESAA